MHPNDVAAQQTKAWQRILATNEFLLERNGRYLKASLLTPHLVLSTSFKNGGQRRDLTVLLNHQSCEGSDHRERHELISELGQDGYHDVVCAQLVLDPASVAMMGTAANMNYASVVEARDEGVCVTAVVTAGVQGNAACAGDPAAWRETDDGWKKIASTGTINTLLFINRPLTEGALARAVITMTEAKSAALTRLAIGSLYSRDAATGTGTDQYCLAAALIDSKPLTSTSPHVKLGELIGVAVRDATLEALRWQNGLEPSYTRSIFHALGRYGLKEATFFTDIAGKLTDRELELLRRNSKSVFYEPLVSASAYAIAAVLDRVRHETIPLAAAREALCQQAATMALSLAAKPHLWFEFRSNFGNIDLERPVDLVLNAIAVGWASKWK